MSTKKIDIINKAYEKGRISGLTSRPTPENIASALGELEDMAAKWAGPGKNICVGYNFEDTPDANSPHNVPRAYHSTFYNNLAVKILANFGKEAMQSLQAAAAADYSAMSNATAVVRAPQVDRRMPLGGRRGFNPDQYYTPAEVAPIGCSTNNMYIGNINDFVEHFDTYLNLGETIASYTLTADTGLTVLSQSSTDTDVLYEIRADGTGSDSSVLQVKIIATTTDGRVETRLINFELTEA